MITRNPLLFVLLVGAAVVAMFSSHAVSWAQSGAAEDIVAVRQETAGQSDPQGVEDPEVISGQKTDAKQEEDEWEEEPCDCGTMAEGECAPCPEEIDVE